MGESLAQRPWWAAPAGRLMLARAFFKQNGYLSMSLQMSQKHDIESHYSIGRIVEGAFLISL
jgi:hypothetical protein